MLESVPRAAAEQPYILIRRVSVHDEVTVGSLFVLANASLDERRVFQGRKTERYILANILQCLRTYHPLTVRRIEFRTACVVGDLEASAVASGNSVAKATAMIGPDGQVRVAESRVALGGAEKKDILLGRVD